MEDIVVAAGVEKMTDVGTGASVDMLASAADREWEGFVGATFPGLYAMIANDYMHRYPLTREQLAMVAVKNHETGSKNPIAQVRNRITVGPVLSSSMVAVPCGSSTARRSPTVRRRPWWCRSSVHGSSPTRPCGCLQALRRAIP